MQGLFHCLKEFSRRPICKAVAIHSLKGSLMCVYVAEGYPSLEFLANHTYVSMLKEAVYFQESIRMLHARYIQAWSTRNCFVAV
jgi:hypothetical protein